MKIARRKHRKLDDFPPEAKALVDKMLEDPRTTYQEIADALREKYDGLSVSSIFRYASDVGKAKAHMIYLREQTSQLVEAVKDHQDIEASEVAHALIMDGLTRRIASADEEYDDLSIEKAGKLLVALQRSAVYKTRTMEDKRRLAEKLEDAFLGKMREKVQADDELLGQLAELAHAASQEVLADESK